MRYADHIREVEKILSKLQTCDDVDDAIKLYEDASTRLKVCEEKVEEAKGRFTEMGSS